VVADNSLFRRCFALLFVAVFRAKGERNQKIRLNGCEISLKTAKLAAPGGWSTASLAMSTLPSIGLPSRPTVPACGVALALARCGILAPRYTEI
jgi:hypothetical protein